MHVLHTFIAQQITTTGIFYQPHRVFLPSNEELRSKVRQSIAFFVHPDNDAVISCIDGSNKYPPITAAEDLAQRFARTFL